MACWNNGHRPLLRAHLNHTPVAPGGVHHGAAFFDGGACGFLDVHVLPRLAPKDRDQRMPMIGCGDEYPVDVGAIEHMPEVLVALRFLACPFFDNPLGLLVARDVDIAHGRHFAVGVVAQRFEVPAPHPAMADQRNANAVVRPDGMRVRRAESRPGRGARARSFSESLQESSSAQRWFLAHRIGSSCKYNLLPRLPVGRGVSPIGSDCSLY